MRAEGSATGRPYQPIEAYALLSNLHGCALVARDGSIDWACLDRFDGAPAFSRLLDAGRGGHFAIGPQGGFESGRAYLPGTKVLETTFTTAGGVLRLTDFMPSPAAGHPLLVRLLEAVSGEVAVEAAYRPLAGFAEAFGELRVTASGATGSSVTGSSVVGVGVPELRSDAAFLVEDGRAVARFVLREGEERRFTLHGPGGPAGASPAPRELLEATRQAWSGWAGQSVYDGPLADDLIRSALTLKALTYAPSGAMIAAATTSLPEEIGGVRNWDYRFCWIRDACLSFYALKKLGMVREAEAFFGFVASVPERDGGGLRPLYAIAGEADLAEVEIAHFEGWRGSRPVRHGNEASEQHQSDAYGQVLDLLDLYERLGGTIPGALRERGIRLADIAAGLWERPDAGLWEPRRPEQRYLHAAVMNWVALERAGRLFGERPRWREERERIVAWVNGEALHPDGYYPQYQGGDEVDAALLLAPMVGFPVDEAAFARTVDAIVGRLGHGALLYRYRGDDGLPGHEGTFLICAFWLVDALAWLGREEEARTRFAALRALRNDVGLFPEEIAEDGTFLGNFPQAFSHLGFIHSALVLDLLAEGGPEALRGGYADRTLRGTGARRVPAVGAGAPGPDGPAAPGGSAHEAPATATEDR